jgi:hypothetical protein
VAACKELHLRISLRKPWKKLDLRAKENQSKALLKTIYSACKNAGMQDLDTSELLSLAYLQHDPQLAELFEQHAGMAQLKQRWVDSGISSLVKYLSCSPDEALLLKEEMMVSYAAFDVMREKLQLTSHMPGSWPLKQLAKSYNAYMSDKLGFTPVANGKGYQVDVTKLHEWIVSYAVMKGLDPNRIPRNIKYKFSLDGSNMGSRNCEMVWCSSNTCI